MSRPRRRGLLTCAVLSVAAIGSTLAGVVTPTASASQGTHHDALVSENPADNTPHLLDGTVTAVAVIGDTTYVGGTFTKATNADGGPEYARYGLLAFDRETGAIDPTFTPQLEGRVAALAPGPEGSVFVGGAFGYTDADGKPSANVARLDAVTGAPVRDFRPAVPDRDVRDLEYIGGRLFIAGEFTKVGDVRRGALAELDPTDGSVQPRLALEFARGRYGGPILVHKMDVTPDGTTMVVVGNFSAVDGLSRPSVAVLDLGPEQAVVADWRTLRFDLRCSRQYYFMTRDVELSPDGSYFVIVTTGTSGQLPRLCDTASRWELAARGDRVQPTWVDYTGGDSLYSTVITDTAVYVGGHQRWLNNPDGSDIAAPGAVGREGVAALDPVNGLPLSWNPGKQRGVGVQELYATPDGLYMGSDTEWVAGERRRRLAFFPLDPNAAVPEPPDATLPVEVYLFGSRPGHGSPAGESSIRHRTFDGSVGRSTAVSSGMSWRRARAATVIDDTLYMAWQGGHLFRRPFQDGSVGPRTEVPLLGLTEFGDTLDRLSGLFYSHGRLYYTRRDRSGLYSRAFTVESHVIGARPATVSRHDRPVRWSKVDGMFLAGGRLYWVHRGSGVLRSVRWINGAPVRGTTRKVSGPHLDGIDWRARALAATDD